MVSGISPLEFIIIMPLDWFNAVLSAQPFKFETNFFAQPPSKEELIKLFDSIEKVEFF